MKANELEKRKNVILSFMKDDIYTPMRAKEIAAVLNVPKAQQNDLRRVLEALLAEDKIEISKNGKYSIANKKRMIGTFSANSKGFGFVTVEGQEEDYFVPKDMVNGALHADTVEIMPLKNSKGQRQEVKVTSIIERGLTEFVGTFEASKNFGFVVPDNERFARDIFIPKEKTLNAKAGQKVVCKVLDYGNESKNPTGVVTEILGFANDKGVDILSIAKAHGIVDEFGTDTLQNAKIVAKPVSEKQKAMRKDLRSLLMVTIDGDDSKDLDDAVSLSFEDGYYHLGVHIADVSEYVKEYSPLDIEAKSRGTSVYLLDRVIPMLPKSLSNGICSLNEQEERLALSCLMKIDKDGNIIEHEICESVIKSNRRMTYNNVAKILLENDSKLISEYEELVPMFKEMEKLSTILRNKRHERGSIDFDFPETVIKLDENGRAVDVYPYERNIAHLIIEDFMLAANETVAEHFATRKIPFVYRSHGNPDKDKISALSTTLGSMGYSLRCGNDDIKPKQLQQLLESVKGTPEETLITRLTLRSMQQARYTTTPDGHFGLAATYYCHFTSPIRRYPDLQIHRIIKENLHGEFNEKRYKHYEHLLDAVASSTSALERRAEETERDVDKMKKVEYMTQFVGKEFIGTISGVTEWGFYVELDNSIEGLVHVRSLLDDHYIFIEDSLELVGKNRNIHYKLGQTVKVKLLDANVKSSTIDFVVMKE